MPGQGGTETFGCATAIRFLRPGAGSAAQASLRANVGMTSSERHQARDLGWLRRERLADQRAPRRPGKPADRSGHFRTSRPATMSASGQPLSARARY
jgi:hypothetical protein